MHAKIIEGDFANQQVSVEEIQNLHSRVRLLEGNRKGCVLYISNQNLDFSEEYPEIITPGVPNSHDSHLHDITPPEHIEHAEKPVETEWKEIWRENSTNLKFIIALILLFVFISALLVSQKPAKQEPTKIEILTQELNELNTLDSQDVSIRNSAQDRINSRKGRKEEILQTLKFYK